MLGGEAREAAGPPFRGQHVVRARHVVAERHRGVSPDERSTGASDAAAVPLRVRRHEREVLGRIALREFEGFLVRTGQQDGACVCEGGASNLRARSVREQTVESFSTLLCDPLRSRDQDTRCVRVVFRLCQQFVRDPGCVRGFVRDHEDLRGPRRGVDHDAARDLPLGFGDPVIPGTDDRVDRIHGLGSERQCGDRSRAADRKEPVGACRSAGRQFRQRTLLKHQELTHGISLSMRVTRIPSAPSSFRRAIAW